MTAIVSTIMGWLALVISCFAFADAFAAFPTDRVRSDKELDWCWKFAVVAALFFMVAK